MRSPLPLVLALAVTALVAPAPSAIADTVVDKPRLAVVMTGANATFLNALKQKLLETRRFNVVDRPDLTSRLARERIKLGSDLTVQQSRRALAVTNADMVLEAEYQSQSGTMRVNTRLYDFRSGEFSRDLALLGQPKDTDMLAGQLATFVRHAVPIRCLVKDLADDQVILDLGAMDGVQVGTFYRVYRHPQNMKPVEIGLVRVAAVEPFAAVADVEESVKGITFQRGDALVERTSGFLVSLP